VVSDLGWFIHVLHHTFPSWKLAQPFRFIAHNGEINYFAGNLNLVKDSEKGLLLLIQQRRNGDAVTYHYRRQSDSACLII